MRLCWLFLPCCLFACGPDVQPPSCGTTAAPDFDVLIRAEYGPLPPDTVIRLHYGGRASDDPEELDLADPKTPQALFCYVSDRDGHYPKTELALGGGVSADSGAGGEGGAGGEPGAASAKPIDALYCQLWTDGSADLDVITETYGKISVKLETQRSQCTIDSTLELVPADGGT